jgi:hypothetical protein
MLAGLFIEWARSEVMKQRAPVVAPRLDRLGQSVNRDGRKHDLTVWPLFSIIGRIGPTAGTTPVVQNGECRKEAQMQYRIALMSKTLLQRSNPAFTARQAGKPRPSAQDTRAFEEYNP